MWIRGRGYSVFSSKAGGQGWPSPSKGLPIPPRAESGIQKEVTQASQSEPISGHKSSGLSTPTAASLGKVLPGAGSLFSKVGADVEALVGSDGAIRRVVVTLRYRPQVLRLVIDLSNTGKGTPITRPPADDTEPVNILEVADLP